MVSHVKERLPEPSITRTFLTVLCFRRHLALRSTSNEAARAIARITHLTSCAGIPSLCMLITLDPERLSKEIELGFFQSKSSDQTLNDAMACASSDWNQSSIYLCRSQSLHVRRSENGEPSVRHLQALRGSRCTIAIL